MRSLLGILLAFSSVAAARPDLGTQTLAAWNNYISSANANLKTAAAPGGAFLRIDKTPDDLDRVHHGDVIVSEGKLPDDHKVPNGAIHDWIGTVFIPNATLDQVLNVVWSYEQYPQWYGPTVTQAHLLDRNGDEDRFSMLYVRSVLFVTVAIEMEYVSHHSRVDATHLYSIAQTSHIYEIHNYGKPDQSKTPADDGSGYIWRVHSISKYEQRDDGVYIEQENIVLSQRIPAAYRWLVEPAVKRLARNLLEGSLRQTREAVRGKVQQ